MSTLTLLESQSRFGDKSLKFEVVCPQNGTGVLKGLKSNDSTGYLLSLYRYVKGDNPHITAAVWRFPHELLKRKSSSLFLSIILTLVCN